MMLKKVTDQVLYPYKTTGKKTAVLYILIFTLLNRDMNTKGSDLNISQIQSALNFFVNTSSDFSLLFLNI
jgi:hypothetical protein